MDDNNYVAPSGGGQYAVVVNGSVVGNYGSQNQAEQAYNTATGQSNGPSGGANATMAPQVGASAPMAPQPSYAANQAAVNALAGMTQAQLDEAIRQFNVTNQLNVGTAIGTVNGQPTVQQQTASGNIAAQIAAAQLARSQSSGNFIQNATNGFANPFTYQAKLQGLNQAGSLGGILGNNLQFASGTPMSTLQATPNLTNTQLGTDLAAAQNGGAMSPLTTNFLSQMLGVPASSLQPQPAAPAPGAAPATGGAPAAAGAAPYDPIVAFEQRPEVIAARAHLANGSWENGTGVPDLTALGIPVYQTMHEGHVEFVKGASPAGDPAFSNIQLINPTYAQNTVQAWSSAHPAPPAPTPAPAAAPQAATSAQPQAATSGANWTSGQSGQLAGGPSGGLQSPQDSYGPGGNIGGSVPQGQADPNMALALNLLHQSTPANGGPSNFMTAMNPGAATPLQEYNKLDPTSQQSVIDLQQQGNPNGQTQSDFLSQMLKASPTSSFKPVTAAKFGY